MSETTESAAGETVTARIDVQIAGTQVQATLTVPTANVPPGSVLPVLHVLAGVIETEAATQLDAQGKRISCRAGCASCCRQLVPITKVEARHLAEIVAAMPEPRQSQVRARFDEVIHHLHTAGLLDAIRHPENTLRQDREALGLAYFTLGIPCPFLDVELCSIHADRPLVCREFLVTSPPEHCANPAAGRVEGVKLPVHLSAVLARLQDENAQGPRPHVALPLALEWAQTHPDDLPRRPGPDWIDALFRLFSPPPTEPPA